MAEDFIKGRCPHCSTLLNIKDKPGIRLKEITCPVCKQKFHFSQMKPAQREVESEHTQVGDFTQFPSVNHMVGQLRSLTTGEIYALHPGVNIVGRKSDAANVDVAINTGSQRRMSRQHLIIEVKDVARKGIVHYARLYKEQLNATSIAGLPLSYGDCVELVNGVSLQLPDVTLVFEIPDAEKTQFC